MIRWVSRQRHRLRAEEDGSVLVFTGLVLVVLFAVAAVAVDLGRLAVSSRDQQGAADRAALDGLQELQQGDPSQVATVVERSLLRNAGVWGGHAADIDDDLEMWPVRCGPGPGQVERLAAEAWGDAQTSGVEVLTRTAVGSLFLPNAEATPVERRAVACASAVGSLRIGSSTASLSGGLVAEVLDELTGGALDLEVLSFRGIATASLDLGLLATELGVGSVDELLEAEVTVGELTEATIRALEAGSDETATADLTDLLGPLGAASVAGERIALADILGVDTGAASSGLDATVDAVDLVVASVQAANRERAIDLELIALGDVPVELTIIEPPRIAAGRPGKDSDERWRTQARTSQLTFEIALPLGEPLTGTQGQLSDDNAARVSGYRQRIDAAGSRSEVRSILQDLEAELEEVEAHLEDTGHTGLAAIVAGLISALGDVIDGLLSILCLTTSCAQREAHEEVDEYEDVLAQIEMVATDETSTGSSTLAIETGVATAALARVGCADPTQVDVEAEAEAARVSLPPTRVLDLGPLGWVDLELDESVGGSTPETVTITAPFPSDPHAVGGTTQLGLTSLLTVDSLAGSQLLLLPIGELIHRATALLAPVLDIVDDELDEVLDALGAQLGGAELQVLDADCSGRYLAR